LKVWKIGRTNHPENTIYEYEAFKEPFVISDSKAFDKIYPYYPIAISK
jgi:hypothetical protein